MICQFSILLIVMLCIDTGQLRIALFVIVYFNVCGRSFTAASLLIYHCFSIVFVTILSTEWCFWMYTGSNCLQFVQWNCDSFNDDELLSFINRYYADICECAYV